MQNFFTREDVLAYHQQGVQTIRLDSMPILTDLARETLQTLGMEIVTGAAPAAQPAFTSDFQIKYFNNLR